MKIEGKLLAGAIDPNKPQLFPIKGRNDFSSKCSAMKKL